MFVCLFVSCLSRYCYHVLGGKYCKVEERDYGENGASVGDATWTPGVSGDIGSGVTGSGSSSFTTI